MRLSARCEQPGALLGVMALGWCWGPWAMAHEPLGTAARLLVALLILFGVRGWLPAVAIRCGRVTC